MAWTLYPPRPGKCACWYVRGTYLGIALDGESTEETEQPAAEAALARMIAQAQQGVFKTRKQLRTIQEAAKNTVTLTVGMCADGFIKLGGSARFLQKFEGERTCYNAVRAKFENTPVESITQLMVDDYAAEVYPNATATTRYRQLYSPLMATLNYARKNRANVLTLTRPEGYRGVKSEYHFEPAEAFAVIKALFGINREVAIFCLVLYYTGLRLGELLQAKISWLRDLSDATQRRIVLPLLATKTGKTSGKARPFAYLPPAAWAALQQHPRGLDRDADERLFPRFHGGGEFTRYLHRAIDIASKDFPRLRDFPKRKRGFHLFRHSYATEFQVANDVTTEVMVEMGIWATREQAGDYTHKRVDHKHRLADNLPNYFGQAEPVAPAPAPVLRVLDGGKAGEAA